MINKYTSMFILMVKIALILVLLVDSEVWRGEKGKGGDHAEDLWSVMEGVGKLGR